MLLKKYLLEVTPTHTVFIIKDYLRFRFMLYFISCNLILHRYLYLICKIPMCHLLIPIIFNQ